LLAENRRTALLFNCYVSEQSTNTYTRLNAWVDCYKIEIDGTPLTGGIKHYKADIASGLDAPMTFTDTDWEEIDISGGGDSFAPTVYESRPSVEDLEEGEIAFYEGELIEYVFNLTAYPSDLVDDITSSELESGTSDDDINAAFDENNSTRVRLDSEVNTITVTFNDAQTARGLSMYGADSTSTAKDFILYGSNDLSSWDTLVEGQLQRSGLQQYFPITLPSAYMYYKIEQSTNWGYSATSHYNIQFRGELVE
jgi:hypothetical protein